jgi:hypothetical protein
MISLQRLIGLAFVTSLAAAPAQAGLQFGEPVDRAAALHISQAGLDHIGDAIEGLVPTSFPISDVGGELYCADTDAQPLLYALDSLEVLISADNVELTASDGRLDLTLYGTLGSSLANLVVQGDCSVLTGLDEVCQIELPTTALSAHIGMAITEFEGVFTVDVDDLSVEISPINNPISDCTLASVIGTLLGQDEAAISNLLLGFIEPELEGLDVTIEESIEDALNGLSFDTTLDLGMGGLPMDLALYPSRLELGEAGMILGFGAVVYADGVHSCVGETDGSPFADSDWPELSGVAPGSSLEYDLGLVMSRDFLDHVLWALWASGNLCIDLQDLSGLELQTSLLESFFGESFEELFPEPQDALISVRPTGQPTAVFSQDSPPLAVAVEDLGLNLIAGLNERQARIFRVGLDADVGVDVEIDSEAVTPVLFLDPADFTYNESYNDLLDEGFSDGFQGLVEMVLDMFLPDDLISPIALPDTFGIGVGGVFWLPAEDDAWQGVYLLIDASEVEPLELGGCSGGSLGCGEGDTGGMGIDLGELGCDEDGGCSGGCGDEGGGCEGGGCGDEGGGCGTILVPRFAPWRVLLFLGLGMAVFLRRRRSP